MHCHFTELRVLATNHIWNFIILLCNVRWLLLNKNPILNTSIYAHTWVNNDLSPGIYKAKRVTAAVQIHTSSTGKGLFSHSQPIYTHVQHTVTLAWNHCYLLTTLSNCRTHDQDWSKYKIPEDPLNKLTVPRGTWKWALSRKRHREGLSYQVFNNQRGLNLLQHSTFKRQYQEDTTKERSHRTWKARHHENWIWSSGKGIITSRVLRRQAGLSQIRETIKMKPMESQRLKNKVRVNPWGLLLFLIYYYYYYYYTLV